MCQQLLVQCVIGDHLDRGWIQNFKNRRGGGGVGNCMVIAKGNAL